jgi:multidrug efflux pump subunit AcrA (membrane-fusion protein)
MFERVVRQVLPTLGALAVAGAAAAGPAVLSNHQIKRDGIVVESLQRARFRQSVAALGVILDPVPLIRLHGEIAADDDAVAGAKAKVLLEQQQMVQAKALYRRGQIISMSDYQKAAEDLAANQAALAGARVRRAALLAEASAHWGAAMAGALRSGGDPLPQLAAGQAILVGLSLPPGARLADPPREVEAEIAGKRIALHLIGPVPGMLGGYPGQSILYHGNAQAEAPVGATVSAALSFGPERSGVIVPRSAVVWQGGTAFVFRADAGNRFEPVSIATGSPAASGYFVPAALSPGDRVVVHGAALLLGGAQKTRPADEED